MPSAAEVAINAGGAAYRAAQALFGASGQSVSVSESERDRRREICAACEFFAPKQQRCAKCGCFTHYKTWLRAERCPIGRW